MHKGRGLSVFMIFSQLPAGEMFSGIKGWGVQNKLIGRLPLEPYVKKIPRMNKQSLKGITQRTKVSRTAVRNIWVGP